MEQLELFDYSKWFTVEELARLSGFSVSTLKKGDSPLFNLGIDLEVESKIENIGGHKNIKLYSDIVLKALKQYQIRNSAPNALKNKETAIIGNVSAIQTVTVQNTIEKLMDNPETLQLMLTESLKRNVALQQRAELAENALKRIEQAPGCFSIAQTAKALKLPYGRNTLFDKLRDLGLLNSYNEPYQEQINANHFKVVNKICGDGKSHIVPLVTGRGLVYLAKKFNASIDENIKADC